MKGSVRSIVQCAALLVLLAASAPLARAQSPLPTPFERMVSLSQAVQSYTASVHAAIAMHTFPFLSPTLDGTYYHKEPSKNKIVFTNGLPFIAKEFSKVYPEVESPSRWNDVYVVSTESDNSNVSVFRLVPRKHGRVDHIDATVDDRTGEVISMRWNYNDGGYATLDQSYSSVDGHLLVTRQTGHFEVPHYDADLTSTFSNFKIDANIPDSVFTAD